jgi:hypothetical protein
MKALMHGIDARSVRSPPEGAFARRRGAETVIFSRRLRAAAFLEFAAYRPAARVRRSPLKLQAFRQISELTPATAVAANRIGPVIQLDKYKKTSIQGKQCSKN